MELISILGRLQEFESTSLSSKYQSSTVRNLKRNQLLGIVKLIAFLELRYYINFKQDSWSETMKEEQVKIWCYFLHKMYGKIPKTKEQE